MAQTARQDSLILDSARAFALQHYHAYLHPEPGLYRGPEYADYAYQIQDGYPYCLADSPMMGSVLYNGILYRHIPLQFDLVKGLVVTMDPYHVWKIALDGEHLDSFTMGPHVFVHLRDSLAPGAPRNGFYEQLYGGRLLLLKREAKTVQQQQSFGGPGFEKYVLDNISYYLKKDGRYYPVNNRKELLAALKEKSRDIKKYIRSNHLRMRKDKENTLLTVITWCDGPTPH